MTQMSNQKDQKSCQNIVYEFLKSNSEAFESQDKIKRYAKNVYRLIKIYRKKKELERIRINALMT